jgi:hypothetical protein
MSRKITLWSQDYQQVLLKTTEASQADQFLRDSGHDWLPMVVQFGKERWSGRVELKDDGAIEYNHDSDGDDLGPGLHKVGPAPYDYVYKPANGQRLSFVDEDGHVYAGTVADVVEDEETGATTLTLQQFDTGLDVSNQ